jgi:hypothetical protein
MRFYYGGAEVHGHRKLLAEQEIPHVSLSFMGLRRRNKFTKPWLLTEKFGEEQGVLIDSGCHTLNREGVTVTPEEIANIATSYDNFVAQNLQRADAYIEFDALAMGKEWIENRRERLDPDKAIVVWHEEWGVEELRRLADRYNRIAVGQGTCGDRDIVPVLRSLARSNRLHGFGFSSPPLMLAADWDSVSSTTWLSSMSFGETFVWTGKELRRYPARYKEQSRKRHRVLFTDIGLDADLIEADNPTEVLKLSLWSWQHQVDYISRRHGDAVTPTPDSAHSETEETALGVPTATLPQDSAEVVTEPPAKRVTKLLPGIESEAFTHRYTDPDSGERKSRTEHRINVVDLNIRQCTGCFLANKCPDFQPGANCAYEIPIRVKTKEQYLSLLDSLIAMQGARVFFMRLAEEADGGYADQNLSKEMDRLTRYIKIKSDIEEAGFTFSMKVQQKGDGQIGLMSRLFGEKAGGVPALSPAGAVSAQEALDQMGILDAEIVE